MLSQSPAATRTLAALGQQLSLVGHRDPSGSERQELARFTRAYLLALQYSSHPIWQTRGLLDRLVEAAALVGGTREREAVLRYLYDGAEAVGAKVRDDFPGHYRRVYLAIMNLVMSRERWDKPTLQFALGQLGVLAQVPEPRSYAEELADDAIEAILTIRRREAPDPTELLSVLRAEPSAPRPVHFGAYSMTAAVRTRAANQREGKVLELREVTTALIEDTELGRTLDALARRAHAAGSELLQLADWGDIHWARRLVASGNYEQIKGARDIDRPTLVRWLVDPGSESRPGAEAGHGAQAEQAEVASDGQRGELQTYLDSVDAAPTGRRGARPGWVRLGDFRVYLRPSPYSSLGTKVLTVANVQRIRRGAAGSQSYAEVLAAVGEEAAARGFDVLSIEGAPAAPEGGKHDAVDARQRYWRFYERLGYERVAGGAEALRSYFKKLR